MRLQSWVYAGLLAAVLLGTTACAVDDPWLKPKLVRVVRAPSAQIGDPSQRVLAAYTVTDTGDPNVRHWLTSQSESWPINTGPSMVLIFEEVQNIDMTVEELNTAHGSEFGGPTIVRSTRSIDEGEQQFP